MSFSRLAGFAVCLTMSLMAVAQTVVATIPVGSVPSLIAADVKTNKIYVTNAGDNTVSVIDGVTNTVIDVLTVGQFPQAVTVNPVLDLIYVGNIAVANQISVINGTSNFVRNIHVSKIIGVTGLAANPSTASVYACNSSFRVDVLDGHTNRVTARLPVPSCGLGLAVNSTTNLIYAATFTPNITVIDGTTNQIVNTLPLDLTGVVSLTVDTQTNRLGLVDTNAGKFEVVDAATGAVLGTVSGLQRPFGGVFEPGAKFAVVTEETTNDMVLINTQNFKVVSHTPVGKFPLGLDLDPFTHFAYVVNSSDNTVSVVGLP
jgi:YVTN family beta-propeller protein